MLKWIPYAMVRVAAFFIGGVLLGIYWPTILPEGIAVILFLGFVFLFGLILVVLKKSAMRSVVSGMAGLCAVFVAGFVNLLYHTET